MTKREADIFRLEAEQAFVRAREAIERAETDQPITPAEQDEAFKIAQAETQLGILAIQIAAYEQGDPIQ